MLGAIHDQMKRIIINFLSMAICCSVTAYIAYRMGYQRCGDAAQLLRYSDATITLDALKDLRAGHVEDGIRNVEAICLSHAAMVYGDPRFRERFPGGTNALVGEFRQYLGNYHTNQDDWPVVVRLRRALASWHSSRE